MSRIETPASIESSPAVSQPLLEAVKKQLGSVPNLFRIVGNSPAALEGYLGLSGALGKGRLDLATRQRLALAVAAQNGCDYCLGAHTFIGKNSAKLEDAEMNLNRDGTSADKKAAAAVRFAIALVRERGHVSAEAVDAVKAAGWDDGQVVEIIAHVALNTLTNYVNAALKTDLDFPEVAARGAYDGLCAVAVAMGERVDADARSSTTWQGRLYRFSSPEAKAMFDADPRSFVAKAESHWPRMAG